MENLERPVAVYFFSFLFLGADGLLHSNLERTVAVYFFSFFDPIDINIES
jgi:hypothetical protein